jgi:hypothetical protein
MKKLLFLGSIATLFISCEGNTNREYIITNTSQDSIKVRFNNNYMGSIDSFDIAPQSSQGIFEYDQRGGSDYSENISSVFDSFVITNSFGDTCTKSVWIDDNWEKMIGQIKRVPSHWEHDYFFNVDDSNF